jgi:hypothetical protein
MLTENALLLLDEMEKDARYPERCCALAAKLFSVEAAARQLISALQG